MKILETCMLKSLEYGDYFQFKGRDQMYVIVNKNKSGTVQYKSTYSGRVYTVGYWQKNYQKLVEILQYGN